MAGDPLQHVQSGDPLAIQAETFNCLIDAARDYKQRTRHLGRPAKASPPNPTVVSVRNDSGSDQPRFAVLGLDRPIILPTDNLAEFASRATAVGVVPTADHVGRWCVLAEPVAAGSIGRAYVTGLFPAKVHVADEDAEELDRCEVRDGSPELEVIAGGTGRVVWKESGTGDVWALVLVGGGPPAGIRSVTMVDTVEEKAWDFDTSGEATLDDTGETIAVVAGDQFTGVAFEGHRAWAAPPEPGESDWRLVDGGTTFLVVFADEDIARGADGPATISGSPSIGVTVKASLHDCDEGDLLYCWWDSPGGGHWDFLRDSAGAASAGCGLKLEDEVFSVDTADLAGFGLRESDDEEDCELEVDPDALAGCGLATDGAGQPLRIDRETIVGFGLADGAGDCDLDVDTPTLAGCGLTATAGNPLDVDRAALKGFGLADGSGTCDVDVDTPTLAGCGLTTDGPRNPLKIDRDEIAGFGLVAGDGTCDVDVDTPSLAGCGLTTDGAGNPLRFDAAGVAGFGLFAINQCGLAVDTTQLAGCGLIPNIVTGQLDVDPVTLAGPGLLSFGLCGLQVDTGCGLAIVGNQVVFDPTFVAGVNSGLDTEGACGLKVRTGCGIKIEFGSVAFDAAAVAGAALEATPGTCLLNVKADCHFKIENDTLVLDVATLTGPGLIGSAQECNQITINAGCGLELNGPQLQLRRLEFMGDGLAADNDLSPCAIKVDWEQWGDDCHFIFDPDDHWSLDLSTLTGPGLMISAQECDKLTIDVGCGLEIDGSNRLGINRLHLIGDGLKAGDGSCDIAVELGCGLQLDGNAIAVDPAALASNDIEADGDCGLRTVGFTGVRQVVRAIECDPYDPYACPVAVIEDWSFENGLLKSVT